MKFIFKLCIYFHTSKEAPKEGSSKSIWKSIFYVYTLQFNCFTTNNNFHRRECSLLLPPVKEGRGIIQLRYAPRSQPEVNLFVTFYSAFKVGAVVFCLLSFAGTCNCRISTPQSRGRIILKLRFSCRPLGGCESAS